MSTSLAAHHTADMGLRTPPPKSRTGKSKKKGQKGVVINTQTEDELQGLLENFDLELEAKEKQFRLHLQTVLAAFRLRQASEISRIPPKLRNMTIEEVEKHWGGNWAGTLGRMAMERQREEEVEEGEKEKALREGVKGKRKRAGAATDSSPERTNKNARKAPAPLKGRPGSTIPASASKRKLVKKAVPFVSSGPSKGPSSLPQNHIFNPLLPPTPLRKMNPTDVLLSMNGSPVVNPLSKSMRERQAESGPSGSQPTAANAAQEHAGSEIEQDEDGSQSDSESDDDELPDPVAYEARILSQSQSQTQSQPARSAPTRPTRPKREPSLLWRDAATGDIPEEKEGETAVKVWVELPGGGAIAFDPLALDRADVNQQLVDRGLSAKEREEVGKLLQAEVVKALQSRMQSWC